MPIQPGEARGRVDLVIQAVYAPGQEKNNPERKKSDAARGRRGLMYFIAGLFLGPLATLQDPYLRLF
jgi:hypothetical protein